MPHQQKLVHIQEIPGAAANGAAVIATGFRIDDPVAANSYAVARHQISVEIFGGDPSVDFRWWTTAVTTAGFTFNWAGLTAGVTIRIVAHVFHSICFDISTAQPPY
jgi:hypothetical protein